MLIIALFAAACGGTPPVEGQMETCDELTCIDGVEVFFDAPAWPDGTYEVLVEIDDLAPVACTVQVPSRDLEVACNTHVWVGIDDFGAPWGIHLDGTEVEWLGVHVSRDGTTVAETDFRPDYWNIRPNGDGCTEACQYATQTVGLFGMDLF